MFTVMKKKFETWHIIVKEEKSEKKHKDFRFFVISLFFENSGFQNVTDNTVSLTEVSECQLATQYSKWLWLFLTLEPVKFKE